MDAADDASPALLSFSLHLLVVSAEPCGLSTGLKPVLIRVREVIYDCESRRNNLSNEVRLNLQRRFSRLLSEVVELTLQEPDPVVFQVALAFECLPLSGA